MKYDGDQGHDHQITFDDQVTWVETKTCDCFIRQGVNWNKTDLTKSRIAVEKPPRLGRLKFDRTPGAPYKKSQHDDLVDLDGWYICVVDHTHPILKFGLKANQLNLTLTTNPGQKRITWVRVQNLAYPDWLERLKYQVYCKKS